MIRVSFAGAALVLCLALLGCGPPQLSRVAPLPPDAGPGEQAVAVGDVVFMTNSVRGLAFQTAAFPQNYIPPFTSTVRIPLRHVRGDDQPNRPLTPNEAALLMSVLAVNIQKSPLDSVAVELNASQAAIWDALVDNLVLYRGAPGGPAQLQIKMEGFCAAIKPISNVTQYFFPACTASSAKYLELRGIGPNVRTLDGLTTKSGNLNQVKNYYQGNQVGVAAAQIVRRGVSMRNKEGDEYRWSLADWEASGVCGKDLKIVVFSLRSEPLRNFQVLPDGDTARWTLSLDGEGIRTVTANPKEASRSEFGTISAADLKLMFPSDITSIGWGPARHAGGLAPVAILGSPAREACHP